MNKFKATCGTAITFCIVRSFIDQNTEMRDAWRWLTAGLVLLLVVVSVVGRWWSARAKNKMSPDLQQPIEMPTAGLGSVQTHSTDVRGRQELRGLAADVVNRKSASVDDFLRWDKQLREIFRRTQDTDLRRDAFHMWEALCTTLGQWLVDTGNIEQAKEFNQLVSNLKVKQHGIWDTQDFIAAPEFKDLLSSRSPVRG